MLFIRSLFFQISVYIVTPVMLLATLPAFLFLSEAQVMGIVRRWARTMIWLLRVIIGARVEVRGQHNLVAGGCIIASQHQSMFETFALIPLLANPTIVMKQQLSRIPIFGLYVRAAGMITVDRGGHMAALRSLAARAGQELAKGREIIIFPEGTRRTPGAAPRYQSGIGLVYGKLDAPVVPVALNSGLYWPRRGLLRYPGTIIVEFLPPIAPRMRPRAFLQTLQERIQGASDALLAEAAAADPRPPFPAEATARLAATS